MSDEDEDIGNEDKDDELLLVTLEQAFSFVRLQERTDYSLASTIFWGDTVVGYLEVLLQSNFNLNEDSRVAATGLHELLKEFLPQCKAFQKKLDKMELRFSGIAMQDDNLLEELENLEEQDDDLDKDGDGEPDEFIS